MKDLKAWALEHGTTADAELLGNLHHLLSPVIGRLRSERVIYRPQADMLADRLYLALALVATSPTRSSVTTRSSWRVRH